MAKTGLVVSAHRKAMTYGEAYQRLFPMAVEELA
jgi:hypothetical protein